MAPQAFVGAAGDATHAYTVVPVIEKTIDVLNRRYSIFGGLGWDDAGREQMVKSMDVGGKTMDIGTSSVIQAKDITVGDEWRTTLGKDFIGLPTHGNAPVKPGQYPEFLHDNVKVNMFDSPEFPFWGEMDQQRFANMISNLEPYYQKKIAMYMADWTDFLGLQSCFHGADRGLLLTTDGGLQMQLMNAASAGDPISCKNTFVGRNGMVAWNASRATFEASVGHAIYDLTDNALDGFSLERTEVLHNQLQVLGFQKTEFMGKQLQAIALCDPWLVKRLIRRNSNNTYYTLLKDADVRGPKNQAIDHMQSVIVDGVLYMPVDWMRAFRAKGNDNVQPTYGAGLTSDPQEYIKTADTQSKKCAIIYLGARALLCAKGSKFYGAGTDVKKGGRIWFTYRNDPHGKGGGWAAHTKVGFKRYEPTSKLGGAVEYHNDASMVAWFYDPGPGTSFAA
jgi:hypothetical protein